MSATDYNDLSRHINDKEKELINNKEKALINVRTIQICLRMGLTMEQIKKVLDKNESGN